MTTRAAEYTPRAPTETELSELAQWLMAAGGYERDDAELAARYGYVAVFDKYITDGPGYVSKVMSVVWSGSPTIFNVFTWEDGKLEEAVHDLLQAEATE